MKWSVSNRPGRTSLDWLVNVRFRKIYQEQSLCSFEKSKNNLHVLKREWMGERQNNVPFGGFVEEFA